MENGQLRSVLWHIRRIIGLSSASGLSDGQLLERFATRHEEAAFEALMQRHGAMVLGVCQRILHHPQDAEDAFQATFLLLVRQAGSITKQQSVGSWLYGVAYRLAVKARANSNRRRVHERQVANMRGVEPSYETVRQALEPVIDEELNRLPEKYRAPVVLCYLEGKAYAEAAQQLGCPKGTVSVRLARARALLRRRLARRGVVLSLGLLGAALAQSVTVARVSPALATSTWRAARLFLADMTAPGAVVQRAAEGTRKGQQALRWAKSKTAAALVLAATALVLSTGLVAYQGLAGRQTSLTQTPIEGSFKAKSQNGGLKNGPLDQPLRLGHKAE